MPRKALVIPLRPRQRLPMERLLLAAEVAEVLSVSVHVLARWARLKQGPKVTYVGEGLRPLRRYRREDIEAYLEERGSGRWGGGGKRA